MTLVVDLSSAWPSMSAAVLKPKGIAGVIAYAGCDATAKNVQGYRVKDWLDNKLMVGLVVENFADDLKKGAAEGARQGANLAAAAGLLGYDVTKYVGFLSADWNVPENLYATVAAACDGARPHLPVLGLYGPGPLLDWLLERGHIDVAWNSESLSFGAQSKHAVMCQVYNDARVTGMPVDANNVTNLPLRLLGEAQAPPIVLEDDMSFIITDAVAGEDPTGAQYLTDLIASAVAIDGIESAWFQSIGVQLKGENTAQFGSTMTTINAERASRGWTPYAKGTDGIWRAAPAPAGSTATGTLQLAAGSAPATITWEQS